MDKEKVLYMDIVRHYEECFRLYGDCCKGVDWPNEADAEKRYGVMLELINFDRIHTAKNRKISVLDFGCGLGHLYHYIVKNGFDFNYMGVDISNVFIEISREKYPEGHFLCTDILKEEVDSLGMYDYIFANGVFTEKRGMTFDEMFHYTRQVLCKLFKLCRCGMSFNVMSKDVDWERDDLFHLSLNDLSRFLTGDLTRDYIIRNDYGLYEYTTYVYKR